MKASIELKLGPRRAFTFDCERVESGVAINPVLPENFDCTDNDVRPGEQLAWWDVPYIVTSTPEPAAHPEWCQTWVWPVGAVCYELRCLNGGAWDRSTWCGVFPTLEEALAQVPNAIKDYGLPARERCHALVQERLQALAQPPEVAVP